MIIKPDEYGEMWHLVIPPIMALLDDYEPKNKLRGVKVVFELFRFVPKELLKRTGIDELIHTVRDHIAFPLRHSDGPRRLDCVYATPKPICFFSH